MMFLEAVKVLMLSPPMLTAPLKVMSPVPPAVPAEMFKAYALPVMSLNVMPGVLTKELWPVSVMGPVTEAAVAAELKRDPPDEMPVPSTDSALGRVMPFKSSAAPLLTVMAAVPSAPLVTAPTVPTAAMPNFKLPAAMLVPPA